MPARTLGKLEPVPVIETAHRLCDRIGARFPDRGIHRVAQELVTLTEQVADTSAGTRRRSRLVRAGSRGLIGLVVLVAVVAFGFALESASTDAPDGLDWLPLIESAVNDIVFVAIAVVVLHSFPERVQRSDLLAKLHRLRSLAHIIDMHQLTKEPESLRDAFVNRTEGADVDLTPEQVEYYLEYCTELLSLVGKAAALCAEESQDDVVLNTVSTIESLTMGMSRKVWQKIFVLSDERNMP